MATDEHSENMSDYASFVQKVKTTEDVKKGYYKLRIRFGDATHISCTYRLADPCGPYRQEGIDDNEIGAGRTILNTLKQKALSDICVYIVRWYGGVQLGPRCFQILTMLTEAVIGTYQFKLCERDRATRALRSLSQSSIESVTSQQTDISFDTAESGNLQTLQGEHSEETGILTRPEEEEQVETVE